MRGVVPVLFAMLLAGCSGAPGTETEVPSDPMEPDVPALPLDITLGNLSATPFTVNLTSSLPANETLNATWSYAVIGSNVTENATVNLTIQEGQGTGLPGNFSLSLEPGNYTLNVTATLEGYLDAASSLAFSVGALVDEIVESAPPCDGVGPQETLTFSGTHSGSAGSNIVMEIPVGPCQSALTASASYLPTAGDIDHSLKDPSGSEVDSSAGFIPGEEGDVSASGNPHLVEGVWTFTIEMFAAGPSTYDVSVTFA